MFIAKWPPRWRMAVPRAIVWSVSKWFPLDMCRPLSLIDRKSRFC
jgi:hypothetical protein